MYVYCPQQMCRASKLIATQQNEFAPAVLSSPPDHNASKRAETNQQYGAVPQHSDRYTAFNDIEDRYTSFHENEADNRYTAFHDD